MRLEDRLVLTGFFIWAAIIVPAAILWQNAVTFWLALVPPVLLFIRVVAQALYWIWTEE